jgi:hypothetical protein
LANIDHLRQTYPEVNPVRTRTSVIKTNDNYPFNKTPSAYPAICRGCRVRHPERGDDGPWHVPWLWSARESFGGATPAQALGWWLVGMMGWTGETGVDALAVAVPGTAGTPAGGTALRQSRHRITPGVEAELGGTLWSEAAFLHPGTSGTLRDPSAARESVGVIVVSFGEAAAPAASLVRARYDSTA